MPKQYSTLKEFYPFYLTEHQNWISRNLHFLGTFLLLLVLVYSIYSQNYLYLLSIPIIGYGFAWIGHAFFEKNKPATFEYPLYSLASDFIMFWHILTGQINKKMKEAKEKIEGRG